MRGVNVYDFGLTDGIQTYRVMGDKEDLEKIIQECRDEDAEFIISPELTFIRRGQWTTLLQLKISSKG